MLAIRREVAAGGVEAAIEAGADLDLLFVGIALAGIGDLDNPRLLAPPPVQRDGNRRRARHENVCLGR